VSSGSELAPSDGWLGSIFRRRHSFFCLGRCYDANPSAEAWRYRHSLILRVV
jgi:hypothetical protein